MNNKFADFYLLINMKNLLYYILPVLLWKINCEIFSSTLRLCYTLTEELNSLQKLEEYFSSKQEFSEIQMMLANLRKSLPKSYFKDRKYFREDCFFDDKEITRFVGHPLNAYFIIKRTTNEWVKLLTSIKQNKEITDLDVSNMITLPSKKELEGVRIALFRLSKFYKFDPLMIANGSLSPELKHTLDSWTIVPTKLSSDDIYEIGRIFHDHKIHRGTVDWMKAAYDMVKNSPPRVEDKDLEFQILDYLSWSEFTIGMIKEAREHLLIMNKMDPTHERTIESLKRIKEKVGNEKMEEHMSSEYLDYVLNNETTTAQIKEILTNSKLNGTVYWEFETALNERLCKTGKLWDIDEKHLKGLKCYVAKGTNKFGKFQHTNVEEIYHDPDAFIFRQLVKEAEIVNIKKLAALSFKTATVHNTVTGLLETADYRISQSSWHDPKKSVVLTGIKDKVMVATQLTMKSSEDFQISNYGLGGFYDAHFDYATMKEPSYNDTYNTMKGPRLATLLLYLSNVKKGGDTAFGRLGISVAPSKGDALFWYNLHPDLTGDARTRHIACPVAVGEKWVGNFWIRSKGEELTKACNLQHQDGI